MKKNYSINKKWKKLKQVQNMNITPNEKARQYFKDAGLCYPISKQDWRMLITILEKHLDKRNEEVAQMTEGKRDYVYKLDKTNPWIRIYGFSKNGSQQVSRVYFEAIAVGVSLALQESPLLTDKKVKLHKIVKDSEFLKIISGKYHTHTPERICARIDYIKKRLLESK